MKDGMGVPMSPVTSRAATSLALAPPLKFHDFVRFAGLTGLPQSSLSSGADGPSPRPALPWHLLHSMASNISLPRARDSLDEATSFGRSATLGASLNASPAKVLRYATRCPRSRSGGTFQPGIEIGRAHVCT